MGFFESIIKIAGEDGKLGDIVKTATEGGSIGDLINVATDNGSVGDIVKKITGRKTDDVEEEYDEETVDEEEVELEEETVEEEEVDGDAAEEPAEEGKRGGFGAILGNILKNADLGEIAKGVIGIIGLAAGAKRSKA